MWGQIGNVIKLTALMKGKTIFISFFATTAAATKVRQHVKVGKEYFNVLLFSKALFKRILIIWTIWRTFSEKLAATLQVPKPKT